MTLEIQENTTPKYPTTQEIVDCFKGVGQTELPLRNTVVKSANKRKQKNPKRARFIFANYKKKPSQTYLSNLNSRMLKADKLWHSLWAHEKGELLKVVGITNPDSIMELAEAIEIPDCVANHFMLK